MGRMNDRQGGRSAVREDRRELEQRHGLRRRSSPGYHPDDVAGALEALHAELQRARAEAAEARGATERRLAEELEVEHERIKEARAELAELRRQADAERERVRRLAELTTSMRAGLRDLAARIAGLAETDSIPELDSDDAGSTTSSPQDIADLDAVPDPPSASPSRPARTEVEPADENDRFGPEIHIAAGPFENIDEVNRFERELAELPDTCHVRVVDFADGRAQIELHRNAEGPLLGPLAARLSDRTVELVGSEDGKVDLRIAPRPQPAEA
jgi:hypothetical protein